MSRIDKPNFRKAVAIAVLVFAASLGVVAQTASRGSRTILQLEDRWRIAQQQNDHKAYEELLAPDLSFIGTSGSFRDKAGFIASRKDSAIPRSETYTYSEVKVRIYGRTAIVTGRGVTTGKGVAFEGRFTHVWTRRKGRWLLTAIQRTDITP